MTVKEEGKDRRESPGPEELISGGRADWRTLMIVIRDFSDHIISILRGAKNIFLVIDSHYLFHHHWYKISRG